VGDPPRSASLSSSPFSSHEIGGIETALDPPELEEGPEPAEDESRPQGRKREGGRRRREGGGELRV